MAAFATLAALCAATAGAAGLPRVERASPRATVEQDVAWAHVRVDYGRPEMRGRAIFGQAVPFDRVWRFGSDEATELSTDADLALGSLTVPAGSYALFVVPHARTWTLVVNKVAEQWGAWNWNPAQDLGRVELEVEALETPVEALTLELAPTGERSAALTVSWERSRVTVPLSVVGEPPVPAAPTPPAAKSKPAPPPPGGQDARRRLVE